MRRESKNIVRGERLTHTVTLTREGTDFAGATFTAQVRSSPDAGILHSCSVSAVTSTVGIAVVTINVAGSVTRYWPERVGLDLSVSKPSAAFGPWKPYRLTLCVEPDYTRDPDESLSEFLAVDIKRTDGQHMSLRAEDDNDQVWVYPPAGIIQYDYLDFKRSGTSGRLRLQISKLNQRIWTVVSDSESTTNQVDELILLRPGGSGKLQLSIGPGDQEQITVIS